MHRRDVFLPSLTTILISAMMMFLSCASQNRVKDELDLQAEAGEEEISDVASTEEVIEESSGGEETVIEVAEGGEVPVEGGEQLEQLDAPTEGEEIAALDGTAAEGTPAEGATAEGTPIEGDGLNVLEDIQAEETGTTAAADAATETAAAEVPVDAGADAAAAAALTSPESTEPALDVPADTASVEAPQVPADTYADSSQALDVPSTPTFEESARPRRFSGSSRVPTVPGKAVTRAGDTLNRFYFVRQGDTPAKVSELLYGNSDRAKDLKRWNKGSWSAGKMVFYSSPVDPNDGGMQSFYQERNVQHEEYTVKRGDWLSTVAKKQLGNWNSWKEIAVVNGMMKPDALEVGQKLAIYPKDLSGFGGAPQVAQAERQPEPPQQEPITQEPPHQEPIQQPPPVQQAQIPPQEEPIVEAPPVQQPKSVPPPIQTEALDTSKFIEQNALAIVILGAAVVLLLALVMRKKKSPKLADEFGEDNFAPPTKLKRK